MEKSAAGNGPDPRTQLLHEAGPDGKGIPATAPRWGRLKRKRSCVLFRAWQPTAARHLRTSPISLCVAAQLRKQQLNGYKQCLGFF